jgi:signal transduction histidine kinase
MKLRSHLFLLVMATIVPVLLFAAGLIAYNARIERESVERGVRDLARALALALDRDLRDIKTAVRSLASSRHLERPPDLRRFYDAASNVSKSFGGWAVLSDPSGRQVINTSRPFGDPLPVPTAASLAMMQSVASERQPFVSNVFLGTVSRRPAVIVAVPVIRDDQVLYVLDFPFEPVRFTRLLEEAELAPEWIGVITDRAGGVVARVPDGETLVGRPSAPVWVERTADASEGVLQGRILSDKEVFAAYRRSREAGWVVGVVVPVAVVEAPLRRSLFLLSGGGAVLAAVASILAFVLGKRIANPIVALAESLKVLSPGPAFGTSGSSVREIEELGHALEEGKARALLLAREQAAREEAEARVERERAARGEAEAANRAKDDFLAVLSHELRTPLNAMLGWVRMLRSGILDAPQTEHALEVIERNVNQQTRLITELLDVSRIIVGGVELDMQPVDLPALVASVVDSMRPVAEAKGVALVAELDTKAGPVHGDPGRLRQVVENILSNAVKFTPDGGRVTVQLDRAGEARLVISDTGQGIGRDFLPHVFDRFRQADSSVTRTQGGLGLGLAIVRHFVELHGGRVSAHSPGEGRGATFTVELPIATPELSSSPAAR